MPQEFQVSVITPVYNAEPFLRRSVEATLSQPEVTELLLVEDASKDGSLDLCHQLAENEPRIRVLRHPDHSNHGAGATRNLGLSEAQCEFIAFADADNFYMPNRFKHDREVLLADPKIDGIVHAQGIHFENDEVREAFYAADLGGGAFLSVSAPVKPDEFWKVMLGRHPESKLIGGLGIDAITLRKTALDKIGYFEPALRLQQDVHFFIRMACTCKIATGSIEQPVAKRGVHGQMRSTNVQKMAEGRQMCWKYLREWANTHVKEQQIRDAFECAYLVRSFSWNSPRQNRLNFFKHVASNPRQISEPYGFFDITLLDLFDHCSFAKRLISTKNRLVGSSKASTA